MIDSLPPTDSPYSRYNVASLHYALPEDTKTAGIDSLSFDVHGLPPSLSGAPSPALLHTPHSSDAETDYTPSRRMSSSAASDSSLHSARADKRPYDFSPSASPVPKKTRPDGAPDWSPQPLAAADDDARSELSSTHSPRVQLPSLASTFTDRHELRRASLPSSLHDTSSNRLRLPTPTLLHRGAQSHSGLTSYQFPGPSAEDLHAVDESRRPRLSADTQIPLYQDYSVPSSAFSGSSALSFSGNSSHSAATSVSDDAWAPGIVRPASTPSHVPAGSPSLKYADDGNRQQALYGGVTRIAGQHHHSSSQDRGAAAAARPLIKTEADWASSFGAANDFGMSSSSSANAPGAGAPSIAVTGSPTRSPVQQHQTSLVERPPRKRGKLPKPVTDYLKDWLHRHSDHPYPSEEEKKALCNATGLSMSQVSNWMINARRRILAPAHRAAAGPQTNMPYAATARPSILDSGRRASMPADGLTLYHPMSLQSLPEYALGGGSTRHMVGMARSMSSSHASAGALAAGHGHHPYALDASYTRLPYGAGGALHPSAHVGGSGGGGQGYLGVPLSAPASMGSPGPFGGQGQMYQGSYSRVASEGGSAAPRYTFPDHGHSVSPQPGSGYTTPH